MSASRTQSRTRNAVVGFIVLSVTICAASAAVQINSVEAPTPLVIDGVASSAEWADAGSATLANAVLMVKHDATHLYLLIDATADTADDALLAAAPWGDFLTLAFDVDVDSAVTPNVDVKYGEATGSLSFGVAYFLAPNTTTGLNLTGAQMTRAFGTSLNNATAHRIWEMALPLSEIGPSNALTLRMGVRIYSTTPAIDETVPTNFEGDFSDLIEVSLAADCNSNNVADAQDIAAATSQDCNGNGVPDECDPDTDGDGVPDDCDNCPQDLNADQADADADGIGDACEATPANPMSCGCFGPALVPFCFAYALYVGHARRRRRAG